MTMHRCLCHHGHDGEDDDQFDDGDDDDDITCFGQVYSQTGGWVSVAGPQKVFAISIFLNLKDQILFLYS